MCFKQICPFFLIFSFFFYSATMASEKRNQLEELLIWKMSDELKLNATEEKKFTEIIKELNKKKTELNHALQISVEAMGQNAVDTNKDNGKFKDNNNRDKDKELKKYRKILQEFNKISTDELDRLRPLLGTERMAQYLVIKQDLSNKIKSMLANPDSGSKPPAKPLPAPKLIEEK